MCSFLNNLLYSQGSSSFTTYKQNFTNNINMFLLAQLIFKYQSYSVCIAFFLFAGLFHCECGKSYRHGASLWKHKNFECGKEPQFKCDFCMTMYTRRETLRMHLKLKHDIILPSKQIIKDIIKLGGPEYQFLS